MLNARPAPVNDRRCDPGRVKTLCPITKEYRRILVWILSDKAQAQPPWTKRRRSYTRLSKWVHQQSDSLQVLTVFQNFYTKAALTICSARANLPRVENYDGEPKMNRWVSRMSKFPFLLILPGSLLKQRVSFGDTHTHASVLCTRGYRRLVEQGEGELRYWHRLKFQAHGFPSCRTYSSWSHKFGVSVIDLLPIFGILA
jgi:hypothetical protein